MNTDQGKRRSYRELIADAEHPPPQLPDGLPRRTPGAREERREQLEATANQLVDTAIAAGVPETGQPLLANLRLEDATAATIYASSPLLAEWTALRYGALLSSAATHLAGHPVTVIIFDRAALGSTLDDQEGAPAPARRPDAGASETLDAPPERTGE